MSKTATVPDTDTVQVLANIELEVPNTPSFLRLKAGGPTFPIQHLGNEELRTVGVAWTEKLIASANAKREAHASKATPTKAAAAGKAGT